MGPEITIRKTEQDDIPVLKDLYREAFVGEDLFPLVLELINDTEGSTHLSAVRDGILLGHITFTYCHASPKSTPLALLGPMAVLPKYQRQGIGKFLIESGLNLMRKNGVAKVLVLGDPNYYGRSGFSSETAIQPTYPIPEEWKPAWQSLSLATDSVSPSGRLQLTKPWQQRELWA